MKVNSKHTSKKVQELLDKVREQIAVHDPDRRLDLEVDDDELRIERDGKEEWIYISVIPKKTGIRPYDYAEMLDKIENQLHKQGHENILLLPTPVEWD